MRSRMSPTEFSNYIKQRAMQQQLHHSHGHSNGHLGPIGAASPSRSLSPNPLSLNGVQDSYYFPNANLGMYPGFNGPRNMFDSPHYPHPDTNIYHNVSTGKFSPYNTLEPQNFYGMAPQQNGSLSGPIGTGMNGSQSSGGSSGAASSTPVSSPGSNPDNSKHLDGLNSFYSNPGPYQHLLVAN